MERDLGAAALGVLVASGLIAGVISVWVFRRFADMDKLRAATNRILAHLLEFRLFADEPALIVRAQLDLVAANGQLLRQAALPSLFLVLPFAVLLAAGDAIFGHSALRAGEATTVTVRTPPGSTTALQLKAPSGFAVETPPIRIPGEREISWRVRSLRAATGQLEVLNGTQSTSKTIRAGPGLHWLSSTRVRILSWPLHPLELPLDGSGIDSISVLYPAAVLHDWGWLVWVSIGSLLGGLIGSLML